MTHMVSNQTWSGKVSLKKGMVSNKQTNSGKKESQKGGWSQGTQMTQVKVHWEDQNPLKNRETSVRKQNKNAHLLVWSLLRSLLLALTLQMVSHVEEPADHHTGEQVAASSSAESDSFPERNGHRQEFPTIILDDLDAEWTFLHPLGSLQGTSPTD